MRVVSTSFDPSFCDEVFPFHFLFEWTNSHWPSLYSPTIDHRILYDLPTLAKIAGVAPCFIPEELARMYFRYSKEYLCFLKGQMFLGHVSREHYLVLVDMISSEEHALGLEHSELEFFISIRHGFTALNGRSSCVRAIHASSLRSSIWPRLGQPSYGLHPWWSSCWFRECGEVLVDASSHRHWL